MFKFRTSLEKKNIIPSIEVYRCEAPITNQILLEYEFIRRAREAQQLLKNTLVTECRRDSMAIFLDNVFPYFNMGRKGVLQLEKETIPSIKITHCEEDRRSDDDLLEEMVQRAQIAVMQLEPSSTNTSDNDDTESSESDEEDNSLNNSFNNSLNSSLDSSLPVTYMSGDSDYLNDNMAKTFNVINKPFQMFNTRKNKSHKFITAQKEIRKIDKSKVKLVNFFAKPLY